MSWITKLFVSNLPNTSTGGSLLKEQWNDAVAIWNNVDRSNAIGVERVLRLLLILSQFGFPALYIRALFAPNGRLYRYLAIDAYVVLKLVSSCLILFTGFHLKYSEIAFAFALWMISDTVIYSLNLILNYNYFLPPLSHKRSLLLSLMNYFSINYFFAILYLVSASLRIKGLVVTEPIDAAYYTFVTSVTVGYGDIVPDTSLGKKLVIFQCAVSLLFALIFISFYLARVNDFSSLKDTNSSENN